MGVDPASRCRAAVAWPWSRARTHGGVPAARASRRSDDDGIAHNDVDGRRACDVCAARIHARPKVRLPPDAGFHSRGVRAEAIAVTPKVTWRQALAWRMRRHYLDPVSDQSVAGVVRRLCGVQAQVASVAELCVRVRRKTSKSGDVARALSEGRIIKTWAMRGTLHLLTPESAGIFLSLIAAGRSWERPARVGRACPSPMKRRRSRSRPTYGPTDRPTPMRSGIGSARAG